MAGGVSPRLARRTTRARSTCRAGAVRERARVSTAEERSAVKEAVGANTDAFLHSLRLNSTVSGILSVMNSLLLAATGTLSVLLWRRGVMSSGEAASGLDERREEAMEIKRVGSRPSGRLRLGPGGRET